MRTVFLCHKCGGTLTQCDLPQAYGCDCISGYVRDWQIPIPVDKVRNIQIAELEQRLALFAGQGRADNESAVVTAYQKLAMWCAGEPCRHGVSTEDHCPVCDDDTATPWE
jgi:hypothetical protein